ncbi:MAG: hypothetical protein EHM91_10835, partial [Planctomycetota bacterium]
MTGFLLTLFFASLGSTVILTPLMIRLARRVGFLDHPGPRKIHAEPIPYGGGIVVALVVLAGSYWAARTTIWPVYALGSLMILVLGVVDDRRKLSAGTKLLVQAIVATGVALGGDRLRMFDVPAPVSIAVTVLWILA